MAIFTTNPVALTASYTTWWDSRLSQTGWATYRRGCLRSITWHQGTEMARHIEIIETLGPKIYLCDSSSPWQRPSNENTNGLLRQYFPKGTDLSVHSPRHLVAVEDELNRRPRIVLQDRAPIEMFQALLRVRLTARVDLDGTATSSSRPEQRLGCIARSACWPSSHPHIFEVDT